MPAIVVRSEPRDPRIKRGLAAALLARGLLLQCIDLCLKFLLDPHGVQLRLFELLFAPRAQLVNPGL